MVLLETRTPGSSREINSEDADQLSLKNFMDFQLSVMDLKCPKNWELKTMVYGMKVANTQNCIHVLRKYFWQRKSTYLAFCLLILIEIKNAA